MKNKTNMTTPPPNIPKKHLNKISVHLNHSERNDFFNIKIIYLQHKEQVPLSAGGLSS
jgi:hypothetical protein